MTIGNHVASAGQGDGWRRFLPVPFILLVLGTGAGLAVSAAIGPQWQVTTTLVYAATSQDPLLSGASDTTILERELADAAALAVSQQVLEPPARTLDFDGGWAELTNRVSVATQPGTDVMTVDVTGGSREEAQQISDAVIESFAAVSRAKVIDSAQEIAAAVAANAGDTDQEQSLTDIAARADLIARTAAPVEVLSTQPATQVRPVYLRDGATGGVLGLLLAAAILILRSVRPGRVRSLGDVTAVLKVPAVHITRTGSSAADEVLFDDVRRLGRESKTGVLVVPAGPVSARSADESLVALQSALADPEAPPGQLVDRQPVDVVMTGDPFRTIIGPSFEGAGVVLLLVRRGTKVAEVRAAQELSDQWPRPYDAAILLS